MKLAWGAAQRLRAAIAAVNLSLGLYILQHPDALGAYVHEQVRPYVPLLAVAVIAGGAAQLQPRGLGRPGWQQALMAWPALPLALATAALVPFANWVALLFLAIVTIAVAWLPWLSGGPSPGVAEHSRERWPWLLAIAAALWLALAKVEGFAASPAVHMFVGSVLMYGAALYDAFPEAGWPAAAKRLEERLRYLESYDPLTNLANRRQFVDELDRQVEAAQRSGDDGALLLLDLDGFRHVNDLMGHAAGDDVLRNFAQLLQKQAGAAGFVARLGGDEFAVILEKTHAAAAEEAARRILREIHGQAILLQSTPIRLTASIGLAVFPEHGPTSQELVAHAYAALHKAKAAGRGMLAVYTPDPGLLWRMDARFLWEERIYDALQNDRFFFECQPVWDLRSGRVSQYELLLRMQGDGDDVYPPRAFLETAEESGLIHEIDRWVVRRAIALLASHRDKGPGCALAVNLSAKAFADTDLLRFIEHELGQSGVDPRRLVLEITETAAVTDADRAQHFVTKLSGIGCRFAIDDFGTGFTSFGLLKKLPVHYLKIDGSFIRNLANDATDREFVKGMVNIAHGLGQEVVAEYVPDEATVEWLRRLEVDHAQGYYLGRPQPVEEANFALAGADD